MIKIDTNKLFVACRVYDLETEIEPWVQYESMGKIEHKIFVTPKRVLLINDCIEGKPVFIDYKTRSIVHPVYYQSSFESNSTCSQSLYLSDFPIGPLTNDRRRYFARKAKEVSFIVPFSEFVKERLGIDLEGSVISFSKAKAIIDFINLGEGKTFKLSFDSETAIDQINKKIYKVQSKVKTKK